LPDLVLKAMSLGRPHDFVTLIIVTTSMAIATSTVTDTTNRVLDTSKVAATTGVINRVTASSTATTFITISAAVLALMPLIKVITELAAA